MRQHDFLVFHDGPAGEHGISYVPVGSEMKEGRIIHVPHSKSLGHAASSIAIHFLEQQHVRATQSRISLKDCKSRVDVQCKLDVERDHEQGIALRCGNRSVARITCIAWPFGCGVVAAGPASRYCKHEETDRSDHDRCHRGERITESTQETPFCTCA